MKMVNAKGIRLRKAHPICDVTTCRDNNNFTCNFDGSCAKKYYG